MTKCFVTHYFVSFKEPASASSKPKAGLLAQKQPAYCIQQIKCFSLYRAYSQFLCLCVPVEAAV